MVCEYLVDPHGNNNLVAVAARLLLAVLPAVEKRDVFIDTVYPWSDFMFDYLVYS